MSHDPSTFLAHFGSAHASSFLYQMQGTVSQEAFPVLSCLLVEESLEDSPTC